MFDITFCANLVGVLGNVEKQEAESIMRRLNALLDREFGENVVAVTRAEARAHEHDDDLLSADLERIQELRAEYVVTRQDRIQG